MATLAVEVVPLSKSGGLRPSCLRVCKMDYRILNVSEELVDF